MDDPGRALTASVDLLAPCALGGFLDATTVPRLRCRAIAGAANNQLATDAVAALLAAREIVWAPDFVVNAGGIVNIAVELEPERLRRRARRRVRAIADTVRTVLDHAEATERHAAGRRGDGDRPPPRRRTAASPAPA